MTPARGDRFEKMVNKSGLMARDGMGPVILAATAKHFLRLQHARYVRMVKKRLLPGRLRHPFQSREFDDSYQLAIENLLDDFTRERGGDE